MSASDFVFAALGGLGEIGMNMALYGYGAPHKRQWLMVDCGVAFAGDDLPGCDLILPDPAFIASERKNLVGIVITHAHEDHFGAIVDLWPQLKVPLYMSPFAAHLLETRRLSDAQSPKIPIKIIPQRGTFTLGPFEIETIPVAHSIPEAMALAITTPLGTALHTGDWKLDATPILGENTDIKRLQELGEAGILALICDSTNITRDGSSPSETEVRKTLHELIAKAPGRVAVTTFASNVARMRAVAEAAQAAGREVIVVGRAMDRVSDIADDLAMMEDLPPFSSVERYKSIPRNQCVLLLTGSQGENRAALARIAEGEHPNVELASGDCVIFSSRTIPGNEKAVAKIVNNLARMGVDIINDRDALVHVSGHPRRAEMAQLYSWLRPQIAIPAHGEAYHLRLHRAFAKAQGVKHVVKAYNGDVVCLASTLGKEGEVIDKLAHGYLYKDGDLLVNSAEKVLPERRKLSFAGVVMVALAVDERGQLANDPEIEVIGLPEKDAEGQSILGIIREILDETWTSLPKAKKRDVTALRQAMERAIRSNMLDVWGKKPLARVLVIEI